MRGIDRESLERVARVYNQNKDASQALGITSHHFARLCRTFDIETPYARRRRSRCEAPREWAVHGETDGA